MKYTRYRGTELLSLTPKLGVDNLRRVVDAWPDGVGAPPITWITSLAKGPSDFGGDEATLAVTIDARGVAAAWANMEAFFAAVLDTVSGVFGCNVVIALLGIEGTFYALLGRPATLAMGAEEAERARAH